KEIKSQFALDVPLITTVTYGNPPMMILDYIEKNQIELVVMGTKGASGLRELLIGSTAEKIVRRSACPVITVRKYTGLKSIRNIVFANSLEDDQERLVAGVKGLQHLLSATVHLVWINTPGNFTADTITMVKLKDFARRYMLANYTLNVFNDSEEETGVINFAHMISGDMIAMGTRGRKGINHILSGSVTEDVVNHVDCPIWTYRQG
ncbi:MAG TPA: universal stress protein, partial [Chryseolinea sp.]|nr:universal stress protein [Chryseolinea sp.]